MKLEIETDDPQELIREAKRLAKEKRAELKKEREAAAVHGRNVDLAYQQAGSAAFDVIRFLLRESYGPLELVPAERLAKYGFNPIGLERPCIGHAYPTVKGDLGNKVCFDSDVRVLGCLYLPSGMRGIVTESHYGDKRRFWGFGESGDAAAVHEVPTEIVPLLEKNLGI